MKDVFAWEPEKTILFFCTQGGHLSGDLLKNLEDRAPQVAAEMQAEIAKDNTIGRYFTLRDGRFGFLITRKHYNTKPNRDEFIKMLGNKVPARIHKTTLETHDVYAKVLKEFALPDIQIYEYSAFNAGKD